MTTEATVETQIPMIHVTEEDEADAEEVEGNAVTTGDEAHPRVTDAEMTETDYRRDDRYRDRRGGGHEDRRRRSSSPRRDRDEDRRRNDRRVRRDDRRYRGDSPNDDRRRGSRPELSEDKRQKEDPIDNGRSSEIQLANDQQQTKKQRTALHINLVSNFEINSLDRAASLDVGH